MSHLDSEKSLTQRFTELVCGAVLITLLGTPVYFIKKAADENTSKHIKSLQSSAHARALLKERGITISEKDSADEILTKNPSILRQLISKRLLVLTDERLKDYGLNAIVGNSPIQKEIYWNSLQAEQKVDQRVEFLLNIEGLLANKNKYNSEEQARIDVAIELETLLLADQVTGKRVGSNFLTAMHDASLRVSVAKYTQTPTSQPK